MKIHRLLAVGLVVTALAATHCMAQTLLTNSYTNSFATGGNTTFFTGGSVASWLEWYGLSFGNTSMTNDPTMDSQNDTNNSGSLYCALPFSGKSQQVQIFGTFDNQYGYDNQQQIPLSLITNIGFDIHVLPGTMTNTDGNFGQIVFSLVDPGWQGGGRVGNWTGITIPGAATNGWVHLEDSNLAADIASMEIAESGEPGASPPGTTYTNAAGFGFYVQSYGGYPTNPITFWIDNVSATTATAPPPPPPPPTVSISPTTQGLTLFAGSGTGINNRESLETTANTYSWVGASGPVSYSFTIASYPIGASAQFQNHIFLDPSPSTGSAPDYSDPNVIFMDLESTATGGAAWMFRYKTNEPNGNSMVYGSGTLATLQIASSNIIGTYTVTFDANTNVTMTVPGGATTNFNIPDDTGATSALFASGVVLYYGVQANNVAGTGDHIVASDFTVTGLGSSDFNDNFVTDAGVLDTNIWEVNAAYPSAVKLIGPTDPYLITWTTPPIGYSLNSSTTLGPGASWSAVTTHASFLAGTTDVQFVSTHDLPAGNTDFFSVVKRTFSQLLILLPGETNAPNTATGKVGTPQSPSLSANGGFVEIPFTVLAVDSHFNPVSGVSDTLSFSDNNGGIFETSPYTLANGVGSFQVYYQTTANDIVINATDSSSTNIPSANSSQFNINP